MSEKTEKQEIYDELKAAGVKVPAYSKATLEGLRKLKDAQKRMQTTETGADVVLGGEMTGTPSAPEKSASAVIQEKNTPPVLFFDGGGWCEELRKSYFAGRYEPKSWDEYEALKKYARREGV